MSKSNKIWFPEIEEHLRTHWNPKVDWSDMSELSHDLTCMLWKIRRDLDIKEESLYYCKECNEYYGGPKQITIRSILYALESMDLIDRQALKKLDGRWKYYRKKNDLDAYGNPKQQNRIGWMK